MPLNLPGIIQRYINASNAHDVTRWVTTTIEKYKFQFKPLSADERGAETILSVEVSGSFPGSPVTLEYQFTIANDKIQSLIIDS